MNLESPQALALGDINAAFKVYMANKPDFDFHVSNSIVHPLQKGDIYTCGQACGNGWRKVFNVYAKLVYAAAIPVLKTQNFACWQDYRDGLLLQANSNTSLNFAPPNFKASTTSIVHLIMGRTYAKTLECAPSLEWLDEEFAVNYVQRIIVCPYFDYRQLSNIKIVRLVGLINSLK